MDWYCNDINIRYDTTMGKIKQIYSYKEIYNPYSNGEEISISLVQNDRDEKYFEVFISSDDEYGCGIYLTPQQVEELINQLKSNLEQND